MAVSVRRPQKDLIELGQAMGRGATSLTVAQQRKLKTEN